MTAQPGARRRLVVDRVADQLLAEHPGIRPVLAVSLDGFHHPRARRHRQGRTSPEGYYADAYDVEALHVDTSEAVARSRAMVRDAELFGGPAAVAEIYAARYHPACALYAAAADPLTRADVVIGNETSTARCCGGSGAAPRRAADHRWTPWAYVAASGSAR